MKLVPVTEVWMRKFLELFDARGLPRPWPSRMAILVADGDDVVMGVLCYDTTGPHLFFEHFVSSEQASLGKRHRAACLVRDQILQFSRLMGKVPHVLIKSKGIDRMLRQVGFEATGAYSLTCRFERLEKHDEQENRTARIHQNRRPSEPDTIPAPAGDAPNGAGLPAEE